jgi:N-acetylneuraminic acid mutarotase
MKKKISIVLVLALSLATVSLAAEDTWTQKADMPTARFGCGASVVNGKIYVIGGEEVHNDPTPFAVVEVYDPATDTWERKADMPTGREGLATAVVDGKIYAIGGQRGAHVMVSTVEVYDPATDTWEKKANMPTARGWFSASALNGKIYAIGGYVLPTMDEYDPARDTWTRKASMPTSKYAFSTSMVNGKIYVLGGVTLAGHVSTVLEYDPATDKWTQKASMPTIRASLSTSVVDGKIYAIGGTATGSGGPGLPTVEVYDPATDSWEKKTDMPTARQICAVGMVDGKIYVIGGKFGVLCFSTVEEYDAIPPLVVDFNGDGKVDCADMCMMVEHWGENYQLCDIAPKPFGDGIVDVQDLIVLAEHLFEDYRLIANWELDETEGSIAHDSTGNNNANIVGDPVWQPVDGMYYGALEFDGIDDYMSTPFILDPMKGSLSAFAWIKGGAPGQVIISQTGNFGGTWLGINSSEGKLMTGFSEMYFGALVSEMVITDGQWHHIGLVYDLDSLHRRLYVDGILVAEDATVVSGMPSDGGLYIGASKDLDATSFFSGLIDDIRIYDVALTAEEILAITQ